MSTNVSVHTYLTMAVGKEAGATFPLSQIDENSLGRGAECTVVLTDPLCSRVHAIIWQEDGAWHIRDADSRNGTYLGGTKIDDAMLVTGHVIRVGSAEFSFHQTEQPPTVTGDDPRKRW